MDYGTQRIVCRRCKANNMPGQSNCFACGAALAETPAPPIARPQPEPTPRVPIPRGLANPQPGPAPKPTAQQYISAAFKTNPIAAGCGMLLLGGLLLIFAVIIFGGGSSSTTTADNAPGIGETGYIYCGDANRVLLAVSEEALEAFTKAGTASDTHGIANLIDAGFLYPVNAGTQVRVIDRSLFVRQVRILEGAQEGQSGWLAREWVSKDRSN